jgi:diguanylate cyclase (GGDEF)-like protein
MPSWFMRCIGPAVALATAAAIWFLNRHTLAIANPAAVYLLAVVFAAYAGGIGSGLVAGAITVGAAVLHFSAPGEFLSLHPDDIQRIVLLAICAPAVALVVGLLKSRSVQALQRERNGRIAVEATNRQLEALKAALDEVDYGVVLLDHELRARFINKAYRQETKLPDAIADSQPPFVALAYHGRDTGIYAAPHDSLDAYVAERVRLVRVGHPEPIDIRLDSGETVRFKCTALPAGGRMLSYTRITDLVQRADEWAGLATVDDITGLFNRRHFLELAEAEWSRFDRHARPLSLIMIDVDRFKPINDTHGHDIGDRVIAHVANICRDGKRVSDIVGRFGGDEFVMLLPETPLENAVLVAERLRRRIADSPLLDRDVRVALTASIGVAEASGTADSVAALMQSADEALYRAKNAGRDRVCVAGTTVAAPAPIALAS